jgi:hypothetical protein
LFRNIARLDTPEIDWRTGSVALSSHWEIVVALGIAAAKQPN